VSLRRTLALFSVGALLAACGTPSATGGDKKNPAPDELRTATLLTPTTGWVLTTNRLLTTSDSGNRWIDVTPSSGGGHLETAFFLNQNQAWAVVRSTNPVWASNYSSSLDLYASSDGGRHWIMRHTRATTPIDTAGPVHLVFIDSMRGWMLVDQGSHAGFMYYKGFRTGDGGDSWTAAAFPESGPILFINELDGFISGMKGSFVSHDGGKSWQSPPMQTVTDAWASPMFELPVFSDERHGVMLGRIVDPTGGDIGEIFYATSDAGRSWAHLSTVASPSLPSSAGLGGVSSSSDWLAGFLESAPPPVTTSSRFELTRDGGRTWEWMPTPLSGALTAPISFAGSTGWGIFNRSGCRSFKSDCFSYNDLFLTADRGLHWRQVSVH
jgi:photosystem II stability/assembly factor-like uncharacterized protein